MNFNRCVSVILVVLVLSGCQSTNMRALNDSLNQAYLSKLQAQQADNQMLVQNAQLALQALATEAQTAATSEAEPRNQIVLYRIAATSAWQSEQLDALAYALSGQQVCASLSDENQIKEMAVHCAMLSMLPIFAEVDRATSDYNRLFELSKQSLSAAQKQDIGGQLKQLVQRYDTMIGAALHKRAKLDADNVSRGFIKQADVNLDMMVCTQIDSTNNLMGTLVAGAAENRQVIRQHKCTLNQLLDNMSCKADIANGADCNP